MVTDTLHSDRFCDLSPYQVYAQLLDDGQYMCGIRTMYRILHAVDGNVKERRRQMVHRQYSKPELLATGPNQVWSWDIAKLKGPVKWTYYYLYVIMDIFSRYVVGWMIAQRELGALAKRLIADTCEKQAIEPDQLIIHSDRGPSMTSKPVALLLSDLGVTPTTAHMSAMITRTLRPILKRSSTARSSPAGSAVSRMPDPFANSFLAGITKSIAIQASG